MELNIVEESRIMIEPLVSIIVITYNSSKYVLETLESAKAQTYRNIELIISDDCSTDNTVEICRVWIEENKSRFVNTDLITVAKNAGIPANCNRGINSSNGQWIKIIDGDDILIEDCINSFAIFINIHPEAKIIESASQFFKNELKEENFFNIQNLSHNIFFDSETKPSQQYNLLLRRNYLHGPSVFLNKEAIEKVGLFDERFKLIEDHPMWLKLTKAGFKIYFLNKITVYYRIHQSSVFGSFSNSKLFNNFYQHRRNFDIEYIYPNISLSERISLSAEFYRKQILDKLGMNRNYFLFKVINSGSKRLSPYKYIINKQLRKIEKRILSDK
jgi:alpha-1,3-rhamnosyltransferase